jgi:uncharacterized protein YerC
MEASKSGMVQTSSRVMTQVFLELVSLAQSDGCQRFYRYLCTLHDARSVRA